MSTTVIPRAQESIQILEFGAQYSQLIARRVRENNVYCEILPYNTPYSRIRALRPKGIILSGGPASVYIKKAPRCDPQIFKSGIPILGICYGLQLGVLVLGGKVTPTQSREYGRTEGKVINKQDLFAGLPTKLIVWMSHGDRVSNIAKQFTTLARTKHSPYASIKHKQLPFYGVQFHPEVTHTPLGSRIIRNFLYKICGCRGTWKMKSYIKEAVTEIRNKVGKGRVICGLSGGIDSAVTAVLIHKAIGRRLTCVFVDNGLLRKDEAKKVRDTFKRHFKINLVCVNAVAQFLRRLKGITDPEAKRKIIGNEFIEVFTREARKLGKFDYLAQGTLYPDVIESVSAWGGPTARIKSHHNVGGLPRNLPFKLIEPLRYLFKDEVRELARQLRFSKELIRRQPFPGPGLAVRVLGKITPERLDVLRAADDIITCDIEKTKLADKLWQYFAVLLPVNSVGVMGDERTYANAIVIRTVESSDGMTADWSKIPYELISHISSRITNEVKGINRVVLDVTSKPPSTIEWE